MVVRGIEQVASPASHRQVFADAQVGRDLLDAGAKALAHMVEVLDDRLITVDAHGLDGGRQAGAFGTVGGGEQEDALLVVEEAAQFHHFTLAGECRQRETIGQRLAEARHVGRDAIQRLGAALVEAEAADGLVQRDQGAIAVGQVDDLLQEAVLGLFGTSRLQQHHGDAVRVLLEELLQAVDVVVVELDGEFDFNARDAAVHGGGADEPVVVREEGAVAADGHQVTAGVGAGQLQRGGQHRGAVLGKLDHLGAGHQRLQHLGAFQLDGGRAVEVVAQLHLSVGGLNDGRVGVAEGDGAQAHAVFDEFVAVHVPDVAALAALDETGRALGILVIALGVGVCATRNGVVNLLAQGCGLVEAGAFHHAGNVRLLGAVHGMSTGEEIGKSERILNITASTATKQRDLRLPYNDFQQLVVQKRFGGLMDQIEGQSGHLGDVQKALAAVGLVQHPQEC